MLFVLFDVDGTLVYSGSRDSQTFAETYEVIFGAPMPGIDWHSYPHMTDTTILILMIQSQFNRPCQLDELQAFESLYVEKLAEKRRSQPDHYRMVPGAKAMVEYLSDQSNVAIGVATGGWYKPQALKLDHVSIKYDHLFFHGANGHVTREGILQAAIDEARYHHPEINRVVYVGDALWDVKTTRNMNMPFIGIRWQGDHHVLETAGAQHVLQNFSDQSAFLSALEQAQAPAPQTSTINQ